MNAKHAIWRIYFFTNTDKLPMSYIRKIKGSVSRIWTRGNKNDPLMFLAEYSMSY